MGSEPHLPGRPAIQLLEWRARISNMYMYMYIYIYIERERERYLMYLYVYIYIYIYIVLHAHKQIHVITYCAIKLLPVSAKSREVLGGPRKGAPGVGNAR